MAASSLFFKQQQKLAYTLIRRRLATTPPILQLMNRKQTQHEAGGIKSSPPATTARSYSSSFAAASCTTPSAGGSRRRFESTVAAEAAVSIDDESPQSDQECCIDDVPFTSDINFIDESDPEGRVPCYRALDHNGNQLITSSSDLFSLKGETSPIIAKETGVEMYRKMVTLQTMDLILYEAQRQGRLSFYLTSTGEEAISVCSAAALSPNDVVFAQYREPGVLLWRGFTLQEFANQCLGNENDYGKGRQMPVHYGSKKLNCFTISSPIATQIPQAVGAAYALKMNKNKEDDDDEGNCVVCYMGDGATSEGDFHAGLNFAAVTQVPIVFICRNNGWAISTPVTDQFRSDGIVVKGRAYGIRSIRVDGNDAVAVYNVIKAAREMSIRQQTPILVEAMTYRVSHHSTSDDSTKYRPAAEIQRWKMDHDPLTRFRTWIENNGWWGEQDDSQLRTTIRKQMIQALSVAEKMKKPQISELFTDVYDQPTQNLLEQEKSLRQTMETHPADYPAAPF